MLLKDGDEKAAVRLAGIYQALQTDLERAKEMLRAGQARVLDVAIASGFKTQQHFARVFRRMCGATPKEYRKEFLRLRSLDNSASSSQARTGLDASG